MGFILNALFFVYFLNFFGKGEDAALDYRLEKANHKPKKLTNNELIQVAQLSDMDRFRTILSHILVPRVVGSDSHMKVREYIMSDLKDLNWTVDTQESTQNTPLGTLPFFNIIARLNPAASRYLVLSCHYDSKHMREGEFLGATDSAVPCSMMIDLAHALQSHLEPFRSSDLSLMFIFFDGEEAFVHWGPNDSIYGARSLAAKWEDDKVLDRIDLFVLLDLLGAPDPSFYSYHYNTNDWYLQVASAEKRLTSLGKLKKNSKRNYFHSSAYYYASIEDDHLPFLRRDVPCLHIIPSPFPKEWHKLDDNMNALDMDTIDNLNKIFRVFTLEYLGGSSRTKRDVLYEDL